MQQAAVGSSSDEQQVTQQQLIQKLFGCVVQLDNTKLNLLNIEQCLQNLLISDKTQEVDPQSDDEGNSVVGDSQGFLKNRLSWNEENRNLKFHMAVCESGGLFVTTPTKILFYLQKFGCCDITYDNVKSKLQAERNRIKQGSTMQEISSCTSMDS
eukprot:TRINITY_DN4571_c1_g1_i1.p1 TRINITY_DN4571_c1_g1~~TRINITY_DN4571_c1_g1_i1.p1  ORF type:complete len:180 (-),score=11.82 TRINITY_DN4571_c1_g1_i1:288-752(-)